MWFNEAERIVCPTKQSISPQNSKNKPKWMDWIPIKHLLYTEENNTLQSIRELLFLVIGRQIFEYKELRRRRNKIHPTHCFHQYMEVWRAQNSPEQNKLRNTLHISVENYRFSYIWFFRDAATFVWLYLEYFSRSVAVWHHPIVSMWRLSFNQVEICWAFDFWPVYRFSILFNSRVNM